MKKICFLLVLFVSLLVCSCKKNNDAVVTPNNFMPENNLPHFNETNSTALAWNQLSPELQKAIPIENTAEKQNARTPSTEISSYYYPIGTWGGNGGSPFSFYPPNGSRIYAMAIRSGAVVDRITVWYQTSNGTIYVGGDQGGNGGGYHLHYFTSGEHITYVGGRSGALIDQLTIFTNKKGFTYGGKGGSPFGQSVRPGGFQVLGFYGRSGVHIDRIGFYVYSL